MRLRHGKIVGGDVPGAEAVVALEIEHRVDHSMRSPTAGEAASQSIRNAQSRERPGGIPASIPSGI